MVAAWALLLYGMSAALLVLNARQPRDSFLLTMTSWIWAWFIVEMAPHFVVGSAVVVAGLIALGALGGAPGWVGLGLWVGAVAGGARYAWGSWRTRVSVDRCPQDADLDLASAPGVPWYYVVFPWLTPWRHGVRHLRGVVYAEVEGRRLKLDVYRPACDAAHPLPAVVHVHGGGWVFGSRRVQGLPLLNHLVANGWIGFNIDYRLSPRVTLPVQAEDVKRAIAWVREHAADLGVDPSFVALTGGSAGGHLTALAALTADDVSLQPGFEDVDVHVDAAVPLYGVYDFLDPHRRHHRQLRRVLEWLAEGLSEP